MAAGGVYGYSQTAGSNTTIAGVSVAEGWAAENVNNSIRGMAADVAKYRDDTGGALTLAGGTTAYTLTTSSTVALTDGFRIHAVVNATNTGASTLAVDGLTAKKIRKYGNAADVALAAGELPINFHAVFQYDASADAASGAWILLNPVPLPAPGVLWGLTLSNNVGDATNDIDIAAGSCADSTNTVLITVAAITKRLDAAWAVGTNNGGRSSAAAITDTTYHVYAIYRSDTGVSDVCMDTSAAGPTMPAGYTHYRRIGSIIRLGATILAFFQSGNHFRFVTGVADRSSTAATAIAALTLTVPVGIVVWPIIGQYQACATAGAQVTSLADGTWGTDALPVTVTKAAGEVDYVTVTDLIRTSTSAQIRIEVAITSGTLNSNATYTHGWKDYRGTTA